MTSARAFSIGLLTLLAVWGGAFAYFSKSFGMNAATVLSIFPAIPFVIAIVIRRRWQAATAKEFVYLAIIFLVSLGGATLIVASWYQDGLHERPGSWTLITRQTNEDKSWAKFKRELRKDPSFQGLEIKYFRGVYWVKGSLQSEAGLDRLIALAQDCGIKDRRLDGPYVHSISITIPNSEREKTYH